MMIAGIKSVESDSEPSWAHVRTDAGSGIYFVLLGAVILPGAAAFSLAPWLESWEPVVPGWVLRLDPALLASLVLSAIVIVSLLGCLAISMMAHSIARRDVPTLKRKIQILADEDDPSRGAEIDTLAYRITINGSRWRLLQRTKFDRQRWEACYRQIGLTPARSIVYSQRESRIGRMLECVDRIPETPPRKWVWTGGAQDIVVVCIVAAVMLGMSALVLVRADLALPSWLVYSAITLCVLLPFLLLAGIPRVHAASGRIAAKSWFSEREVAWPEAVLFLHLPTRGDEISWRLVADDGKVIVRARAHMKKPESLRFWRAWHEPGASGPRILSPSRRGDDKE